MRSLSVLCSAILLTACAGQQTMAEKPVPAATPAPVAAPAAATPVAAAPVEKKAPQCYSGDDSKFFNVGEKTKIAGIDVVCATNSDGKSGQWSTGKK